MGRQYESPTLVRTLHTRPVGRCRILVSAHSGLSQVRPVHASSTAVCPRGYTTPCVCLFLSVRCRLVVNLSLSVYMYPDKLRVAAFFASMLGVSRSVEAVT